MQLIFSDMVRSQKYKQDVQRMHHSIIFQGVCDLDESKDGPLKMLFFSISSFLGQTLVAGQYVSSATMYVQLGGGKTIYCLTLANTLALVLSWSI